MESLATVIPACFLKMCPQSPTFPTRPSFTTPQPTPPGPPWSPLLPWGLLDASWTLPSLPDPSLLQWLPQNRDATTCCSCHPIPPALRAHVYPSCAQIPIQSRVLLRRVNGAGPWLWARLVPRVLTDSLTLSSPKSPMGLNSASLTSNPSVHLSFVPRQTTTSMSLLPILIPLWRCLRVAEAP